jgi:Helix-turn-helix domain
MRQGKRFGLSAMQKSDLWRRWKAGQSLHEIGRAFGKSHSSIRCVVSHHGGIVPRVRRRSLLALTLPEREDISRGIASGSSIRKIAQLLDRAASTVSREVVRLALASAQRGTALGESLLQKLDRMELDFARLSRRAELLGELPSAIVALREVRETLKVIHQIEQLVRPPEEPAWTVRIIHVGGTHPGAPEWEASEYKELERKAEEAAQHANSEKTPLLPETTEGSSSKIIGPAPRCPPSITSWRPETHW